MPGTYVPPTAIPGPPPNTYQTPQVVTGTVVLNNISLQVAQPLTPITAAAMLFLILVYVLAWPIMRDPVRMAMLVAAVGTCLLVVLTGSPQYVIGWCFLGIGIGTWEFLTGVLTARGEVS